jgi:hypothetical protein
VPDLRSMPGLRHRTRAASGYGLLSTPAITREVGQGGRFNADLWMVGRIVWQTHDLC